MLANDSIFVTKYRSTGKLSSKDIGSMMRRLETSETLDRYERNRCRREVKFTALQMLTILAFMVVKQMGLEELRQAFSGRGGQRMLKNLGMPRGRDGRYICPSDGWISDFKNYVYPIFKDDLNREIADMLESRSGSRVYTIDSTPLEASRYSGCEFNPHYKIRMCKEHIVMIDGVPMHFKMTGGNEGDNPVLRDMVQSMSGVARNGVFLADGAYDSFETYTGVFLATGLVMSSNSGADGVFHEEATWDRVVDRYNALHSKDGFIPSGRATPEFILRFLAKNGQRKIVGMFLRNLDMRRGGAIHKEHARMRHVCETVHHAMKRWVDYTVRGLHKRFRERTIHLRTMICQMLCLAFPPYEI